MTACLGHTGSKKTIITKTNFLLQIAFEVDLDDLHEMNEDLTEAVKQNTRRYTNMVSDVVYEMLPDYKFKEVNIDIIMQSLKIVAKMGKKQLY